MANLERAPLRTGLSFGAVVLGALICVAFLLLFTTLAGGVGLVAFSLERGQIPHAGTGWLGAVYGLVALGVSFFAGGFVASRFSLADSRWSSLWHGLGSWSIVAVGLAVFTGSLASSLGSVLMQAGVGAGAAAGAAGSVDAITRELSRVRIVTDMKLLKGRAVTQIVLPRTGPKPKPGAAPAQSSELAGIAAKSIPRELNSARQSLPPVARTELLQAAGVARNFLGSASLGIFGALLLGAIAAGLGGTFAEPARQRSRSPAQ